MLINPWSLALIICSAASLFVIVANVGTGFRVITNWDPTDDSAHQIRLESKTWLSALLIEYTMVLQILSVFLLVLAADNFSHILVGAMCATGAFLANPFGIPSLFVKLVILFLCGFWVVVHRLDIRSEHLPLMRFKFLFLFIITPIFILDVFLLTNYLARLEPDIITSCCGVVFGNGSGDGKNLTGPLPIVLLVLIFFGLASLLLAQALFFIRRLGSTRKIFPGLLFSLSCISFFILSLLVITAVISPYIYALPSHRCPFDIFQREYGFIGYPIYFFLFASTFSGAVAGLLFLFQKKPGLQQSVKDFQRRALHIMLTTLPLFLFLVSWQPVMYLLFGGER